MRRQMSTSAGEQAKEWYVPKNYAQAAYFTSLEWAEQIQKRLDIKGAFECGDTERLDVAISGLMCKPLAPYFKHREYLADNGPDPGVVVRDIDFADLEYLQGVISDYRELPLVNEPQASFTDQKLRSYALGLRAAPKEAHLVIRLDASDKNIIAEFKEWLLNRRKTTAQRVMSDWKQQVQRIAESWDGRAEDLKERNGDEFAVAKEMAKLYRDIDVLLENNSPGDDLLSDLQGHLENWHKRKILPYFDLRAWAQWRKCRLTDETLSELLGLGCEQGAGDLRTIKKVATETFTQIRVRQLLCLTWGR